MYLLYTVVFVTAFDVVIIIVIVVFVFLAIVGVFVVVSVVIVVYCHTCLDGWHMPYTGDPGTLRKFET